MNNDKLNTDNRNHNYDSFEESHNITFELLNLLRNHQFDRFIEIVNNTEIIDMNIKDTNSNYLLSYAVQFNKADIVKLILEKGGKYDIVDSQERSILYNAIKYGFIEIIKILLEFSQNAIGIMITDIRDINGNIPLHYAIKIKSPDIIKLLIEYKSDPYTIDINGYNSLHLAIKTGDLQIVSLITNTMSNLNIKTQKGETALHISINYQFNTITEQLLLEGADPNIIDTENEFTALHYAVGWNNITVIKLLLQYNVDINVLDIYGNNAIMYSIKEDNYECFDMLMNELEQNKKYENKIKKILNSWNIEGKILLHEVLENYEDTKKKYLDRLIEESNLTIQDNRGNTCLYYLVYFDIWEQYSDILRKKKLNIFTKNVNGNSILNILYTNDKFDIIKINKYNKFIDIIVNGYLTILKREKKDWKLEFDKICSRELNELSNEEKKMIFEFDKSNKNSIDENIFNSNCYSLIKNKITNDIKKYMASETHNYSKIENNALGCVKSYPTDFIYNDKKCIDIKEGDTLHICTFTGSILDVLVGLMYLLKKHGDKVSTTLGKNYTQNEELCKLYKNMGMIMNKQCEFINFEMVWIDYKLYMTNNFSDLFNQCLKSKSQFIIIPLGIEMKNGSHANYLIYDKNIGEIERFEPHGGTMPYGFNYSSHLLDGILSDYFKSIKHDIVYVSPNEYIPRIGFQIMDALEDDKRKIGDPSGFCALWSIWYTDYRITYSNYSRDKLINALFKSIKNNNVSYRNMIRNYSAPIINERDELLKKVGLDINDWLNDNYTNNQLDKFISLLLQEINKCCINR